MKLYWKLLLLMLMGLVLSKSAHADFADDNGDDDDDGIVEEETDDIEPIVQEKQRYEPPQLPKKTFFTETFDDKDVYKKKWVPSQAKKDGVESDISKYDGKWSLEEPKETGLLGDIGLVLKSKAKHHAVARKLEKLYEFKGNPFIVSYEVKFQNGIDCGGAYIKLLSKTDKADLKSFHDKTPYTIMFGPDKCGLDHKLHFIFRHKNPKTGEIEEKHANKPSGNLDKYFSDKKTHLYTLVVNPDNTFEVLVDNTVVNSGSLLEDVNPPVNPPKEIDDPTDKKPEDWDEREHIADPEASKPEDWDENEPMEIPDEEAKKPDGWLDEEQPLIGDPDADKPEDWDDEMDGEWEAPLIDNPACKDAPGCGAWTRPLIPNPLYRGKWKAPMIPNPDYQGEWQPRRITNPNWFEDKEPYKMTPIEALGLELWSMSDEIAFDNFIVTDDKELHQTWVEQTWIRKSQAEAAGAGGSSALVQGILDVTQERPWLWAVFLIVIVLPVVLVVAYCCMSREKGIWNTLMSSAEERPWLWAVYVVVLLLPIVLLSICLCPRGGPIKQEDIDAARKKTDEASPDDAADDGETQQTESDVGPDGDKPKTSKAKKSKAALEEKEEEEGTAESSQGEEAESKDDKEEEAGGGTPTRSSPRKRRARKD